MRRLLLVSPLLLLACTEGFIVPIDSGAKDPLDTDGAAPLVPDPDATPDTPSDSDDPESPVDTDSSAPSPVDTGDACFDLTISWRFPAVPPTLSLAGEIRDEEGDVIVENWRTWATEADQDHIAWTSRRCGHGYARWEGIATDAAGVDYAWACARQSAAPNFSLVGVPGCVAHLTGGDVDLSVEIVPAPTSDGCEVGCAW
jgi:hypothetical protein